MNNITTKQKLFYDIPEGMEQPLAEEVQEIYAAIANVTIPLLDEIMKQLTYFVLTLAHGDIGNESGFDVNDLSAEEDSIEFLDNFLGDETFTHYYIQLRKNVNYFLQTNNYFYEDNWLFAPFILDYEQGFVNSPLQDVW